MKIFSISGGIAIAVTLLGTAASAGHTTLGRPMDLTSTGCVENFKQGRTTYSNCFTAYEPYATAHYNSLACADPYKGLRYTTVATRKGPKSVLRCTPN
ncbi:hypothetical protein J4E08_07640 [Sagittula sp. NFXS13]|uniref:Uncharacterized protein n=1 Tax=Sagittula marina TaxID=943940 RepID=A0A7W6DMS3_9RHOB|nr:hypothetical protein [Sagittula marina]MBB3984356.1 hypothetical protein [Sagittula marina]